MRQARTRAVLLIVAGLNGWYGTINEGQAQESPPPNEAEGLPEARGADETGSEQATPAEAEEPTSPPTTQVNPAPEEAATEPQGQAPTTGSTPAATTPPEPAMERADGSLSTVAQPPEVEAQTPPLPRGTYVKGAFRLRPMVEVRERFETRVGPYTAAGSGDDAFFVGSRARLGLDAYLEVLRLVVQFADARSFGQFPLGTDGGSTTGLHQGFLEVALGNHWLRLGRQEVNLGRQRMIGALNWSTNGRSFDALRLHFDWATVGLDLLGAVTRWVRRVTVVDETVVPPVEESELSTGDYAAAVYLTWTAVTAARLDAYVLYRHDGATEGDLNRARDIAAPGVRLHGSPIAGLSYEVEGVFQAGRAGGRRHLAAAAAAELAYVVQVPFRPGVALGGSYASGGSPGDTLTEFDNFFPTNHLYYGSADLFGWRNLLHGYITLSATPASQPWQVRINGHLFGLASPHERWANAGGATLGLNAANEDRLLGYELDVNAGYAPWPWLKLALGYALFVPGAAAEILGHDEPTHWAYVMVGSVLP